MDNYTKGFIDALYAYAWWKDGTQYLGNGSTTLKEALSEIESGEHYNYNPTEGGEN